jgi:CubicO group peptidase (beta-lactamase class C family)
MMRIAGRALEAAATLSYREAIRERVFEPLAMDRSFFLASEVIADGDYSHGYGVNDVEGEGPMEASRVNGSPQQWGRRARASGQVGSSYPPLMTAKQ